MFVAFDGEALPVEPRLKRAVHRLQEIVAVRLHVETDQVGAQQPVQQFALPGADAERFRVRPRDVPEDRNPGIRPPLLDHARQQSEMIVLHKNHRVLSSGHLLQCGIGELAIHLLVLLPVGGAK